MFIEELSGISKEGAKSLKSAGITTVEQLACSKVDELRLISGINQSLALDYIARAKMLLNVKKRPKKVKPLPTPELKPFFSEEHMQQIRNCYHKIKKLEEKLKYDTSIITMENINDVYKYITLLNVNYKLYSQIKIFKDLDIYPTFYDTIEERDIKIWDLNFECARALWILAQAYSFMSKNYEEENMIQNAVLCMVQCSKAYKTASYFSTAHTRQEDIGVCLSAEYLELKSEESRFLAQHLAIRIEEEDNRDYGLTSKMYSGLVALLKRFYYLKQHEPKKIQQLQGLINYYYGKACLMRARSLSNSSFNRKYSEETQLFLQKANYYFLKAEGIWEDLVTQSEEISDERRRQLIGYLSLVNKEIIENDVPAINAADAKMIENPEPIIIIPENVPFIAPKSTMYLTKFPSTKLEQNELQELLKFNTDTKFRINEFESLRNEKAAIGRVIKQLQFLYDNRDIDISTFSELFEKYSKKEKIVEEALQKVKKSQKKSKNSPLSQKFKTTSPVTR
ncbi:MAG: hypothetical protein ACFFFB_24530 [Candidatus Heimdallarchaeota archaeon]